MAKLTRKQKAFAEAKVQGHTATEAARIAGYAQTSRVALAVQGARNNRLPEVQAEMRAIREKEIGGELAQVALSTLREIMTDTSAPAPARVSASKWVLEAAGHGLEAAKLLHRIGEGDEKSVSQLSAADLERLVMLATDKVRFERAAVIDAEIAGGDGAEESAENLPDTAYPLAKSGQLQHDQHAETVER